MDNYDYKIPYVKSYDRTNNINVKLRNDEERIKPSVVTEAIEPRPESSNVDIVPLKTSFDNGNTTGVYIIAVVAGISAAATVALIAFAIGWYK